MNKKVGIIYYDDKPILLLDIRDITSEQDYNNLKKLCNDNLNILKTKKKTDEKNYKESINTQVNTLANAIKRYIK